MATNDIGERLGTAIRKLNGRDIKWFQAEISERFRPEGRQEKPGTSYQTVLAYVNGEREPSVGFLRTAARILGVREEWLILGAGEPVERPPDDRREVVKRAVAMTPLGSSYRPPTEEERRLAAEFNRESERAQLVTWGQASDAPVETLAAEAVHQLLSALTDSEYSYLEVCRAAEIVSQLALAPVRAFASDLNRMDSGSSWDTYCQAALHALMLAIPDRAEGRSLEELSDAVDSGWGIPPSYTPALSEEGVADGKTWEW